jgi:hypothetical protein
MTTQKIPIEADERKLRTLVRESIRAGVGMTRNEELAIEDEFVRRVGKTGAASPDIENQARVVALLILNAALYLYTKNPRNLCPTFGGRFIAGAAFSMVRCAKPQLMMET